MREKDIYTNGGVRLLEYYTRADNYRILLMPGVKDTMLGVFLNSIPLEGEEKLSIAVATSRERIG